MMFEVPSDDSDASRGYHSDVQYSPNADIKYSPNAGVHYTPNGSCFIKMETSPRAPIIEIIEQPGDYRYRYEKEKYHGHILGIHSPATKKKDQLIFPAVKVKNYNSDVIIRCWLIDSNLNNGPKAHLHKLARKTPRGDVKLEPHDLVASPKNDFTVSFDYLYIVHAVTNDEKDLDIFEKKKHWIESNTYNEPTSITNDFNPKNLKDLKHLDKNQSILYFEVFDAKTKQKICDTASRKIKNLHNPETAVLKIVNYSKSYGSCEGGDEVFMFVEKISKDVEVRFVDAKGWNEKAIYGSRDIHHQYGIVFKTPPYIDKKNETEVYIQLYRKSDGAVSNRVKFTYKPDKICGFNTISRKREHSPDRVVTLAINPPGELNNKRSKITSQAVPLPPEFNDDVLLEACTLSSFSDLENLNPDDLLIPFSYNPNSQNVYGEAEGCFSLTSLTDISEIHIGDMNQFDTDSVSATQLLGSGEMAVNPEKDDLKIKILEINEIINVTKLIKDIKKFKNSVSSMKNINGTDWSGNSILHIACGESLEAVKVLLGFENIKKLVQNSDGDDPLLYATKSENDDIVEYLLKENFNPNIQNCRNGDTALHISVSNENLKLTRILLQYGANPMIDNHAGDSAYDLSSISENEEIMKVVSIKFQEIFSKRKDLEPPRLECIPENKLDNELQGEIKTLKMA